MHAVQMQGAAPPAAAYGPACMLHSPARSGFPYVSAYMRSPQRFPHGPACMHSANKIIIQNSLLLSIILNRPFWPFMQVRRIFFS